VAAYLDPELVATAEEIHRAMVAAGVKPLTINDVLNDLEALRRAGWAKAERGGYLRTWPADQPAPAPPPKATKPAKKPDPQQRMF
jgi:hypothetical protein